MSIDHTLSKLQSIIHETLPNLELFVDSNIQPSSKDCENLQQQLFHLQEHLSVFKHLKTNKEISPSFGIHSKVSDSLASNPEVITEAVTKPEVLVEPVKIVTPPVTENIPETKTEPKKESKEMEISLNQKFQFINDLFDQNATEYAHAVSQLNDCSNWADADSYLLSLKSAYNWKDSSESYKRLKEIAKKRFD
jgi:hypothetical protein